jgi:hypothetical protein
MILDRSGSDSFWRTTAKAASGPKALPNDGCGHLHGSLRATTHVADETFPLDQVLDLVDKCFEPLPNSGCELPGVTVPSDEKNECRWCHVFAPVQSRLPESVFDLRRTRRQVFREFLTGQNRHDRLAFRPKARNVRRSQLREQEDAAGWVRESVARCHKMARQSP